MIKEGTFSEDCLSLAELRRLTQQLKDLVEQEKREQAAFEKGIEVGKRLAEYQESPY